MPDELRELVERCLAGDEPAMTALVDRFRGQVLGVCLRMMGNRADAEDAAQETFTRALRYLRHWDNTRDFGPWLFGIAGNRCRSLLAIRKNKPRMAILADGQADNTPDPQDEQQLAEEIERALKLLRDEHRQAFLLFHEQQMSYDEIAAALDSPLGTIKTWVHRARRQLAEELIKRGVVGETDHAVR
ncbi:MAG: RNA polymerase sigma factor [Pirellulales bacterium]